MSIVNCVNNWYFNCVLITINLGDNLLSICCLFDKEVFHYESQKVKNRYRSMLHVMTRPKFWLARRPTSKQDLVIIYKLQSVWAYYFRYHLRVQLVLFTLFFAVRLSRLVLTLCNLERYEVDTISGDMVKKKQIMFPISFITHCVI